MPRLPALEALFGSRLGDADIVSLRRLVDGQVEESTQLEFHQSLYAHVDEKKLELAKDICAFANAQGGAIVLGILEADGRAAELLGPLVTSEGEEQWMYQVVAERAFPLPDYEIRRIESSSGQGYWLIGVPPSEFAPHAVIQVGERQRLSYPIRYGRQTNYLTESAVAAQYRDRFQLAERQVHKLGQLADEAGAVLRGMYPDSAWATVTVIPNRLGNMRFDPSSREKAKEAVLQRFLGLGELISLDIWSVGVRRLVAYGALEVGFNRTVHRSRADFLEDGSAFSATEIPRSPYSNDFVLRDDSLVVATAALLRNAVTHAVETAGTSGEAVAELRIDKAPELELTLQLTPATSFVGLRPVVTPPRSRRTIDLSSCYLSTQELLAATRLLVSDHLQAFGLPEPRQMSEDGSLVIAHWSDRPRTEAWADREGVPIH
jgi:hypothetical protein